MVARGSPEATARVQIPVESFFIMFSKKEEILSLKREQANQTKQEKISRKQLFEKQFKAAEDERKAKIYRLEEMERQLQLYKKGKNSGSSKFSSTSGFDDLYLKELRQLQLKAKELLIQEPYMLPKPQEHHALNAESLRKLSLSPAPMKIPILIPHSIIQKSLKIQPPVVQRTLRNGDVCSVYLVSDPDPAYNPMVNAQISLNKNEIGKQNNLIGELDYKGERKVKSISPMKKREEDLDLTKPESINLRQMTPKIRVERHNYRDYSLSDISYSPPRKWVHARMKVYSDIVKNSFKPIACIKKQLELDMIKEKIKKSKPLLLKKYKLDID